MNKKLELLYKIEVHDVEYIKKAFKEGIDPNDSYKNKSLFSYMLGMYTRSPRFKECIRAFLDFGLNHVDPVLISVLLNDVAQLEGQLKAEPESIHKRYSHESAYTQMEGVSLLHICAEYNHVECAKVLLKFGLKVDVQAGIDNNGFGAQTPIFHTVNQNQNQSQEMMTFLLEQKADLHQTVKGLIWGKGFEWETFIPSVNPVSYAMMGLLPQFHRKQEVVAKVISTLMEHKYGINYVPNNIPNEYLKSS